MIGNKGQASKSYIVEYSKIKGILMPFAEIFFILILIFLIYLVMSVFLGSSFFYRTYGFFIYLFIIVVMLSLLRSWAIFQALRFLPSGEAIIRAACWVGF